MLGEHMAQFWGEHMAQFWSEHMARGLITFGPILLFEFSERLPAIPAPLTRVPELDIVVERTGKPDKRHGDSASTNWATKVSTELAAAR